MRTTMSASDGELTTRRGFLLARDFCRSSAESFAPAALKPLLSPVTKTLMSCWAKADGPVIRARLRITRVKRRIDRFSVPQDGSRGDGDSLIRARWRGKWTLITGV